MNIFYKLKYVLYRMSSKFLSIDLIVLSVKQIPTNLFNIWLSANPWIFIDIQKYLPNKTKKIH